MQGEVTGSRKNKIKSIWCISAIYAHFTMINVFKKYRKMICQKSSELLASCGELTMLPPLHWSSRQCFQPCLGSPLLDYRAPPPRPIFINKVFCGPTGESSGRTDNTAWDFSQCCRLAAGCWELTGFLVFFYTCSIYKETQHGEMCMYCPDIHFICWPDQLHIPHLPFPNLDALFCHRIT